MKTSKLVFISEVDEPNCRNSPISSNLFDMLAIKTRYHLGAEIIGYYKIEIPRKVIKYYYNSQAFNLDLRPCPLLQSRLLQCHENVNSMYYDVSDCPLFTVGGENKRRTNRVKR